MILKNRFDFSTLLNEEHLTDTIVEVGVDEGFFAEEILKRWNGKKYYLVDPWTHVESNEWPQEEYDKRYFGVVDKFKNDSRVIIIRKFSEFAALEFADETLNFVYIDANHTYESVKMDILSWLPKVKFGGYLAGHDYDNDNGVVRAVNELGVEFQLISEKILGSSWYFKKAVHND